MGFGMMNPGARLSGNVMFHASRLASFFILDGVIGVIGRAFTLTPVISIVLNGAVALVMLILGLNLLDLFPALKKLQPRMPSLVSSRVLNAEKVRTRLAPALLGLITFFLPCGFTQSMQLFSLTAGSFLNGALTMFAFALGTFPVLALISLASVNLSASPRSGLFFKTAGLRVIAFALVNLMNSFAVLDLCFLPQVTPSSPPGRLIEPFPNVEDAAHPLHASNKSRATSTRTRTSRSIPMTIDRSLVVS
jgi:sulfite exporter TauE/SafE